MEGILNAVRQVNRVFDVIAGICISFIVLLTVSDVILRQFRHPIIGTYEVVGLIGALVIGFAMPTTSWAKAHIFVDFFIMSFSQKVQAIFNIATRCAGVGLFAIVTWNMVKVGMDLQRTGEVTPTLQLPFYPVTYALALCCLMQCIVLLCDILSIMGGNHE
jgi:TRAP-type C4-dicarboxylate transport system permease small subunit